MTAYFCGDHLSGISILPPSECQSATKACCVKSEGKKKCCTSDSEFVQIDIDQLSYAHTDFVDVEFDHVAILPIEAFAQIHSNKQVETSFLYRPPPLLIDQIIRFQNFRC